MFGWINRIRHYMGFGVHSPLAYAFTTEILRTHYQYYAYPGLRAACRNRDPHIYKLAKLLHRITARMPFASFSVSRGAPQPFVTAIKAGWYKPQGEAVLSVVTRGCSTPLPSHTEGSVTLFHDMTQREAMDAIGSRTTGILLAGQHDSIYLATDRMPFTIYKTLI